MDAKPQRPLRVYQAAHSNENIHSGKSSLHQRNKSIGNVKTMANTGTLNAPPKRSILHDLSNTNRPLADEQVGKAVRARAKSVVGAVAPSVVGAVRVDEKENHQAAPVPVAKSYKVAPINATKPTTRNVNSLNQQRPVGALAQPPLKNGVPKSIKPTMIYRDNNEQDVAGRVEIASGVDDLVAIVDKQIKHPRQPKSQPAQKAQQAVQKQTQTKVVAKTEKPVEFDDESDFDDNVTEAAYEDALEQISYDPVSTANRETVEPDSGVSASITHHAKALPTGPLASEEDEYSDEDHSGVYEDNGYTTAHSYRSHGDNTTGGLTTMVAPAVTINAQRELQIAEEWVRSTLTEEEIEEEAWDVSMVAEYGEEIFAYMRQLEDSMVPNPHYMDNQTEIQWSMRAVLMDWLVQVHHRFCLLPETLFLTVNYIDRFLSVKIVSLGKLQLVGATALFVAAKYEEINCPSVQEIVYMVDSGYNVDEILKAERFMLSMLQFELGWPGPMSFLRRISKADDYELETRTLAKYFLEVTIMDERFVGSPASYIAAGAHCISRMFLEKGDWTLSHIHYSGYTLSQLKPLINMMFECCRDPRKHHSAVYDKYASPKYKNASTYVESKMLRGVTLAYLYNAMADAASSSNSESEAFRANHPSLVALEA
ncbi:putative G2/mitotic-specific cyclin-3 [Triangularia verruculosa]|uniref:G2/mitotic-specific cyclin-3 n=1 Tax=Triangularia verruculosa TaxID=2587418 RepID=A0AAN7AYL8_9PEZI|nr:putative G2/mitotic-specific cyclin-3 [Triangularia verruculosa]